MRYLDLVLKAVIWGGIIFILLFIALEYLKVISTPSFTESLLLFIVAELFRLEREISSLRSELLSKLEILWKDLEKRKEL